MKIYISGAITGTDNHMERFEAAEKVITEAGYVAVNPAKINSNLPEGTTYDEYMKLSMCLLEMCDVIYMLDGWEESNGANAELKHAITHKKTVCFEKMI